MIHQVHEHGVTRHLLLPGAVLVLHRHLIEQVEQPARRAIAELVVGDNVEEGDDLVDVSIDDAPRLGLD
jgi:hypothetical protein